MKKNYVIIKTIVTGLIFCNLYAMEPQGPHLNLERTAANICWMNAALQCLAANDDFVNGLENAKKSGKLTPNTWQSELLNMLKAIRNPYNKKTKVGPSGLYKQVIDNPDFGRPKYGCSGDSRDFMMSIYYHLLGSAHSIDTTKPLSSIASKFKIKIHTATPDEAIIRDHYFSSGSTKSWTEVYTFKINNTQQIFFSDYFYYDLGNSGQQPVVRGWDQVAERKEWTDIETTQTTDKKKRRLSCYAILCGGSGHANALIKDKRTSQWYDYNDLETNNIVGEPVNASTVNAAVHSGKFVSGGWHQKVMLMFYESTVIEQESPLVASLKNLKTKLNELKSKLSNLSTKLIQLKNNL